MFTDQLSRRLQLISEVKNGIGFVKLNRQAPHNCSAEWLQRSPSEAQLHPSPSCCRPWVLNSLNTSLVSVPHLLVPPPASPVMPAITSIGVQGAPGARATH